MAKVFTSPIPPVEVPRGNCINHVFKDSKLWEELPALVCGYTGTALSFKELQVQMGRWGSWLTQRWGGLSPERSVVSVVSQPSVEMAVMVLGTVAAGGIFASLKSYCLPSEMARQVEESNTALVVVAEQFLPIVLQALGLVDQPPAVVVIGESQLQQPVVARFSDIVGDVTLPVMAPVEVTGDEVMMMLYTSGTTGLPKCLEHTHSSAAVNLSMMVHPHWCPRLQPIGRKQTQSLLNRDFALSYGFMCALLPGLAMGVCQVVKDMQEHLLLQDMAKYEINQVHITPPYLAAVLHAPLQQPGVLTHFRRLFVSGAPTPAVHAEAVTSSMPGVLLQRCYGMSEAFVLSLDPLTGGKLGYTGQLLPNVQVKVVDPATGQLLPAGQEGIIYIKSPSTMIGYRNNEAATREVLGDDGWMCSGDYGYVDEDAFLCIGDRFKELIKIKDCCSVSPSEIENVILQHPGVKMACVVGVAHTLTGLDAIYAFVVTQQKQQEQQQLEPQQQGPPLGAVSEDSIKDFVKEHCNETKHLTRVVFLEDMPLNINGKIDRKMLKAKAAALDKVQ